MAATLTLEQRINGGTPVLICPRCGWWAHVATGHKIDINAFGCPECKGWIDAVEPRS